MEQERISFNSFNLDDKFWDDLVDNDCVMFWFTNVDCVFLDWFTYNA